LNFEGAIKDQLWCQMKMVLSREGVNKRQVLTSTMQWKSVNSRLDDD